jgi:hypothetical protein
VGKRQASVDNRLLGLSGLYHRHAIGTFNTCSRGSTHRSLTDTSGGYNLRGTGFPHTTPRLSQPTVSTFHIRAPSGLRLSIQQLQIELEMKHTLNPASVSLHSTSTVIYHLSIALLMVSHKEIGLTIINRKVNLNATMMVYNSYRLNAES